jgi:hypothetical protein
VTAEIAQAKPIAYQPARGRCDHDAVRLGQRLQARSEVRRIADDGLLLRRTASHEVADHHEAGGDSNAHLKLTRGMRLQRTHDASDFQSRPDRTLGVVLVGARKAKISQNAVAHEFGDETVIAGDHARTGVLIGANHLPHILRIEPRRQRR